LSKERRNEYNFKQYPANIARIKTRLKGTIDLRVKMILEHDELVSIIPITEEDFSKRNVAFLRNIRKEGIEL